MPGVLPVFNIPPQKSERVEHSLVVLNRQVLLHHGMFVCALSVMCRDEASLDVALNFQPEVPGEVQS